MDTTRIERDLRFLKLYAGAMTLVVGVMSVAAFSRGAPTQVGAVQGTRAKFDEIDVERINVREPNGNYRMVISNRPRSIGPIYKNKPFGYEGDFIYGRPMKGHSWHYATWADFIKKVATTIKSAAPAGEKTASWNY